MNKQVQKTKYIFSDYLSAAAAWVLFFISRKILIESQQSDVPVPVTISFSLIMGALLVPIFWIILYFISGFYHNIYRRSRLNDAIQTFGISFLGSLLLFFLFILDDYVKNYHDYYGSFLRLFLLHSLITIFFRTLISSLTIRRIRNGSLKFNTLMIGAGEHSVETIDLMGRDLYRSGNVFSGYVGTASYPALDAKMPYLGGFDRIDKIIAEKNIHEVVVAEKEGGEDTLIHILDKLDSSDVVIRASAELYQPLRRLTRVSTVFMSPLIDVSHGAMPLWQQNIKLIIDILISSLVLILVSPLMLLIVIAIKLTSKGPVLYRQVRAGRHGKPFTLYKFRSMHVDAEKDGPSLSRKNDSRMTTIGRFLRKTKMDELPNFINVLKGDMSIVGPRPERHFFIEQIIQRAPQYSCCRRSNPASPRWARSNMAMPRMSTR